MFIHLKSKSRQVEDCPVPDSREIEPGSVVYTPPLWAQRRTGVALARFVNDATPGGIRREQFVHRPHPIKTALAMFPFIALVALVIFAAVTRHA